MRSLPLLLLGLTSACSEASFPAVAPTPCVTPDGRRCNEQAPAKPAPAPRTSASASSEPAPAPRTAPTPAELAELQEAALEEIHACPLSGAPPGKFSAEVVLRPNGRSDLAVLHGALVEGTALGDCARRALADLRVLPFQGAPVSLTLEAAIGPLPPGQVSRPSPVASPRDPDCISGAPGRLDPAEIQRLVRSHFPELRRCYEDGLRRDPSLVGRVQTRFIIGRDGKVMSASSAGSDIPDLAVRACVRRGFARLEFPQPKCGIVTVTYPIQFSPDG